MTAAAFVRRVLPAPPDVVFDEWLDAEGMAEWMCPRPALATAIVLEPRVGGTLRIDVEDTGVRVYVSGTFLELERPRLLRFTWSSSDWADPSAQSVVTVRLEVHGSDETLMTIEHEQLPPDEIVNYQDGWALIAVQLASARLARR
jgi:uncharacterized protein YndB with AHSA1/START domain